MLSLETPAIVLRRSDYGESHRMVLLATEQAGILSVVARHARRSVKRFGGGLEFFTLVTATLERKKEDGPWNLARTRIVRFHDGFVGDMGRFAAGSYGIELFRMLVPEEVIEPEVFLWLAGYLERWESELPSPLDIVCEELGLLGLLGHAPRFDRCVSCGREAPPNAWARFDAPAGGIVCSTCGGEGPRLGSRVRYLFVATARGDDWQKDELLVHVAQSETPTLRRCMDSYIRALADREPRSMKELRRAWGMD